MHLWVERITEAVNLRIVRKNVGVNESYSYEDLTRSLNWVTSLITLYSCSNSKIFQWMVQGRNLSVDFKLRFCIIIIVYVEKLHMKIPYLQFISQVDNMTSSFIHLHIIV